MQPSDQVSIRSSVTQFVIKKRRKLTYDNKLPHIRFQVLDTIRLRFWDSSQLDEVIHMF
jgi:hypothetical protein